MRGPAPPSSPGGSARLGAEARLQREAAPPQPLLAVRPKSVSVRREDLLCRRAFHASDGATALESLDEAIRLNPRKKEYLGNRAASARKRPMARCAAAIH